MFARIDLQEITCIYQIPVSVNYSYFSIPAQHHIGGKFQKISTFLTVVDVDLTVPASEASHTVTIVVVLLVDAGRSVLTGKTGANN